MTPILMILLLILAAYLIGSVPFGFLIGLMKGIDIRTVGSRNIGATNVGRALGKKFGVIAFLLDVLKGFMPTLVAGRFIERAVLSGGWDEATRFLCWLGVGAFCVIGHNFPVFLRFRGGKGVATSLGVTFGVYPYLTWPGLIAFGFWGVVVAATRYISLGSICAAAAMPIFFVLLWRSQDPALLREGWPLLVFSLLLGGMVIARHWANIGRLLAGTETKLGSRGDSGQTPEVQSPREPV